MIKQNRHEVSKYIRSVLLLIAVSMTTSVFAQQTTTVLPNNSSYSNKVAPQGALRYQRGFYLITPGEMNSSGITSGMDINSIGFTIGKAQSDSTEGQFKVYLQNTNDVVSRADTGWNEISSPTNEYLAAGLFPGAYEWQVKANCSTNSAFTPSVFFSNDELSGCNNPYNLNPTSITASSAQLNWESSASPAFVSYKVEYTALDNINWLVATTTDNFYNVSGLQEGKTYQWRVTTLCGLDSSPINYANFTTGITLTCNSLTGLSALVTGDTLVALSWTADPGAAFYEIQFRRSGTVQWSSAISNTNTLALTLVAGTSFEWRVRVVCAASGRGAYASSTFVTGGTSVCYDPVNPTTRNITNSSAKLTWLAVPGATSYSIRYRLKNTISWTNAVSGPSPMTLTCDSTLKIPNTTGAYDIPFHGGNTFTFTGGGVYVAWEYARASGSLSTANLSLSTTKGTSLAGANGQDSVTYLLSMVSRADSSLAALPTILGENRNRPETRFGSAGLQDSVGVVAVYALGFTTPKFQSPTPISTLIANFSSTSQTYNVTLTVNEKASGTNRYTASQSITVPATDSMLVSFNGWSPSLLEQDSIIISIPAQTNENVLNNNRKGYLQQVNTTLLAYDNRAPIVTEAGFGTGEGLLLNKHNMQGCGKVISAKVYLTESAVGNPIYAVVRNSTGAIVAQSAAFTAAQSDANKYHSFALVTPASFLNEDFYIGVAQQASASAYNPVGAQWEDAETRTGAYYRSDLDGTNLVDSPQGGRLMIRAEIVSSAPEVFIKGNLTLCSGGSTVLTAAAVATRYANNVSAFSSQYAGSEYGALQALGAPDVFPTYELSPNSWLSATAQSQREYITLGFPNPGKINFVDIYETANPGAVDSIFVKNPSTSNFELVYSATAAAAPQAARKNHITFTETAFDVSEIRIAINSPAVQGYNAIDAVGIGNETTPGVFSSYVWSPGGETTSTKTVSTGGTYSVTATNSNGCSSTASVTVNAAVTTAPVITASGPTAFCPGDSVVLTSSITSGIVWTTGATTPSITVKDAGSYSVTYNGGSCGSLTSLPTAVSINPVPSVSITGPTDICLGNQNTLDAGAGFSSYLWSTGESTRTIMISTPGIYTVTVSNASGCQATASVAADYTVLAAPTITGALTFCPAGSTVLDAGAGYSNYAWSTGATTQTITVTADGTYSVTVSNAGGCTASSTVTTTLFVTPVPAITGIAGFCAGSSTTLTAASGYATYLWSTGATTASVNVNTAGLKTVTVTDLNGCTGSNSITVEAFPNPAPVISGTLSFCGGTSTTLNAGVGYASYLWSTGATTQSIIVSTVGNFSVIVINANGCSASANVNTTQTGAIPVSPGVITGPTIAGCSTGGNIYSIAPVSNTSHYVWMMPAGATISSGQGSTSITVNFAAGFAGGYIEVAASNACGQSPSITARRVFVQSLANAPGAITGQSSGLCGPIVRSYNIASVPLATSYTWSAPAGTNIVGGQGTTTISLSVPAGFVSGNLCVRANNACGISEAACLSLLGLSNTPGAITGPTLVCASAQYVEYSVPAVPGAGSYTWTVPQASHITSGQGTNVILVRFGPKNGNVTVKSNSTCGSSGVQSLSIVVEKCNGSTIYAYNQPLEEIRPVPEVISAYGGLASGSGIIIQWTAGEMMVEYISKTDLLYTQGFHQPLISIEKQDNPIVSESIKVTAYPNPVKTYVNIKFETTKDRTVTVLVLDAKGQFLQSRKLNTNVKVVPIQMLNYSAGTYFIVIKDVEGNIIERIQLIKSAR